MNLKLKKKTRGIFALLQIQSCLVYMRVYMIEQASINDKLENFSLINCSEILCNFSTKPSSNNMRVYYK